MDEIFEGEELTISASSPSYITENQVMRADALHSAVRTVYTNQPLMRADLMRKADLVIEVAKKYEDYIKNGAE